MTQQPEERRMETPLRHLTDDQLDARLDGATDRAADQHLRACLTCSERLALLGEEREYVRAGRASPEARAILRQVLDAWERPRRGVREESEPPPSAPVVDLFQTTPGAATRAAGWGCTRLCAGVAMLDAVADSEDSGQSEDGRLSWNRETTDDDDWLLTIACADPEAEGKRVRLVAAAGEGEEVLSWEGEQELREGVAELEIPVEARRRMPSGTILLAEIVE